MSYTYVNMTEFHREISKFSSDLEKVKTEMSGAKGAVDSLVSAGWKGNDAIQFLKKWQDIQGNKSTYYNMVSALEYHIEFLKYAESMYNEYQNFAMGITNKLSY